MEILKNDWYLRLVLTVIAFCLSVECFRDSFFVREVSAVSEIEEVRLSGISENILPLKVWIVNPDLKVRVENTPLDVIINDPVLFMKKKVK